MFLLLFLTIFGKEISAKHIAVAKAQNEKQVKDTENQKSDSQESTISELSSAMVSAPLTVDFQQAIVPLSTAFRFVASPSVSLPLSKPTFRLAYFEILFEHFICTNAP